MCLDESLDASSSSPGSESAEMFFEKRLILSQVSPQNDISVSRLSDLTPTIAGEVIVFGRLRCYVAKL